jgi:hypothetical protein
MLSRITPDRAKAYVIAWRRRTLSARGPWLVPSRERQTVRVAAPRRLLPGRLPAAEPGGAAVQRVIDRRHDGRASWIELRGGVLLVFEQQERACHHEGVVRDLHEARSLR